MVEPTRVARDAFNEHWCGGYALDAAICGTTDDCVLRFLAANVTVQSPEGYITAGDSAAGGTEISLHRRGKYLASMCLIVNAHADSTLVGGISKDGTVLNADPAYNAAFANGFLPGSITAVTSPAAAAMVVCLRSWAYLDVNDGEAGVRAVVRFHCGDANGTPTANAITAASDHSFSVQYVSDKIG